MTDNTTHSQVATHTVNTPEGPVTKTYTHSGPGQSCPNCPVVTEEIRETEDVTVPPAPKPEPTPAPVPPKPDTKPEPKKQNGAELWAKEAAEGLGL